MLPRGIEEIHNYSPPRCYPQGQTGPARDATGVVIPERGTMQIETAAPTMLKPLDAQLSVQVLTAITAGILPGHFYPEFGACRWRGWH
ncbi:hypothetical protein MASR2M74_09830 [Paracoccaceae bacterium]